MNVPSKKVVDYEVKPWAVKVNLDFIDGDPIELASFIQKVVYFVCVDYLHERITEELLKVKNARSFWLSEVFLYRALSIFNSANGDSHLFDKNDLSGLAHRLTTFILSGKESITFRLEIIERYLSLQYADGCMHFCFHEDRDVSAIDKMRIDTALNAVLANVLKNRI